MKYLSTREQLRNERRKSEAAVSETAKIKADTDYIAMMTGVDLETGKSEVKNDDEI